MEPFDGRRDDLWRAAERLLAHPGEAAPAEEVRDRLPAVRLWHYPAGGSHRSWTVFVRPAPAAEAPLLRGVRWDGLPVVEVRDRVLPPPTWQALVGSARKLLVPVAAGGSDLVVLDRETFGVEFDRPQNVLRLAWQGGHEGAWRGLSGWAKHWRHRLEEHLSAASPVATKAL